MRGAQHNRRYGLQVKAIAISIELWSGDLLRYRHSFSSTRRFGESQDNALNRKCFLEFWHKYNCLKWPEVFSIKTRVLRDSVVQSAGAIK